MRVWEIKLKTVQTVEKNNQKPPKTLKVHTPFLTLPRGPWSFLPYFHYTGKVRWYNWPLGSSIKYISVLSKHCVKGRSHREENSCQPLGKTQRKAPTAFGAVFTAKGSEKRRVVRRLLRRSPRHDSNSKPTITACLCDQGWQQEQRFHVNLTACSLVNP